MKDESSAVSSDDTSLDSESNEGEKSQNRWSKDREKYRRQGHAAGFSEGYEQAKRELEQQMIHQNGLANNSFTQSAGIQPQNGQVNPNDLAQMVQQQLLYQQHLQKMQEATNTLTDKGMQAKGKYSDFEEAIKPLAEDKSQQFLDIIPHLAQYDNAGDMLYHMGKDPMILGNLKGLHGTPTGLKRALDKFSKKLEATKEEAAPPSPPIEPPQSGHGVAGSTNKVPSLEEAKQLYRSNKRR